MPWRSRRFAVLDAQMAIKVAAMKPNKSDAPPASILPLNTGILTAEMIEDKQLRRALQTQPVHEGL